MRPRYIALSLVAALGGLLAVAGVVGFAATTHEARRSPLGTARPTADLLALLDQPGPVELETINSADWAVERSGVLNLGHPKAKGEGLEDGDEPVQVYFHALRHPAQGLFIVDTGVEKALRDAPEQSALSGLVRGAMHMEKMKVNMPLGEWLAKQAQPLKGVFLTHLHLDHITGMADVPAGTPVYTGPGEAAARMLLHAAVQGSTDRALEGKPALSEWTYDSEPRGKADSEPRGKADSEPRGKAPAETGGLFDGAVDIFGDGSVWALWVPGHTPGSTAYLVRSTKGPVLLVGDASHTRWGWEHDVEPGTFTADGPRSVESFQKLRAFAKAHPNVGVKLGHQH